MLESISSWIAHVSYSVLPALGEGMWRGLLLAISVGIIMKSLRFNASSRHALWLLLLISICAIPLFISLENENADLPQKYSSQMQSIGIQESEPLLRIPEPIAAGILEGIFLIVFFRIALLFFACRNLSKLRKGSTAAPEWLQNLLNDNLTRSGKHLSVQIRLSSKIGAPALVGFFHPVVLFPEHLVLHLTQREIQQILLHELAHLKRHDDWVILVQRILSAIFFFNPAVLWISKQMDFEREIACDDSVIEAGGTPQDYALCLTRLAEFSRPLAYSPLPSASSQLSRRVDMLLHRSKKNFRMSVIIPIAGVLILSAVVLWIVEGTPLLAVADEEKPKEKSVQLQDDFHSASKRLKQAERKMEEARQEMLQAAEAMRQAQEKLVTDVEDPDKLDELIALRSLKKAEAVEKIKTLKNLQKSEKVMRKVEKETRKEQKRKVIRVVPELAHVAPNQPLPPMPSVTVQSELGQEQPGVPPAPVQPRLPPAPESSVSVPAPITPNQPLIEINPPEPDIPDLPFESDYDFEADPQIEPEPNVPPLQF
jgi:beta-lactamase regulating signal transducer with metallopeptidase domain